MDMDRVAKKLHCQNVVCLKLREIKERVKATHPIHLIESSAVTLASFLVTHEVFGEKIDRWIDNYHRGGEQALEVALEAAILPILSTGIQTADQAISTLSRMV